jgi:hypothetical protein
MSAFGTGSNSSGQFWFGQYGFLYKKNVGVGGRRSTKMAPGGNITCNSTTNLYNKYKPGSGGVGASSISNRRAKNRLATVCDPNNNNCFPCFTTLGRYNSYTGNPNGFIPCPKNDIVVGDVKLVNGNVTANVNISNMNLIEFSANDDASAYLDFTGMDFYFFGINYGNSNTGIYMNLNYAFGFGSDAYIDYNNWLVTQKAILFDFFDTYNINSYVSSPQTGSTSNIKYVRIISSGTDFNSYTSGDISTIKKQYEIFYVRDNAYQYMQFNCNIGTVDITQYPTNTNTSTANGSNITDGVNFQNTFGSTFSVSGPQQGNSYVIRSDLNGNNWSFFPNTHLIL